MKLTPKDKQYQIFRVILLLFESSRTLFDCPICIVFQKRRRSSLVQLNEFVSKSNEWTFVSKRLAAKEKSASEPISRKLILQIFASKYFAEIFPPAKFYLHLKRLKICSKFAPNSNLSPSATLVVLLKKQYLCKISPLIKSFSFKVKSSGNNHLSPYQIRQYYKTQPNSKNFRYSPKIFVKFFDEKPPQKLETFIV